MTETAIRMQLISKQYRLGAPQRHDTLRDKFMYSLQSRYRRVDPSTARDFWALQDVSFEVTRGHVVGMIGRNGAGKSTLLKILARIVEPTSGTASLYGRVGSLLEVGTGFHAELSGRENIFLAGAILGLRKAEIDRLFDEIVAFAGVEQFLDTPVKRYSSGMYVRLAFAVAAHLDTEILLVDEVLAVGDAAFQKKCLGKMGQVARQDGRTVMLVSHNMAAIQNLCTEAVLLDGGRVVMYDQTAKVVSHYLERVVPAAVAESPLATRTDRSGNGRLRLTSFHIEDTTGARVGVVHSGMDVVFVLGFQCAAGERPKNVDIGFSLSSAEDQLLTVLYSSYVGQTFAPPPSGEFRCVVRNFPFTGGRYGVGVRVLVDGDEADWPRDAAGFLDVEAGDFYGTGSKGFEGSTPLLLNGAWTVNEA